MDFRRIKTVLIFILALLDLVLLGFWGVRSVSAANGRRDAGQLLSARLGQAGLDAAPGLVPDTAAAVLEFIRDTAREKAAVDALLGETEARDLGGGIMEYESLLGTARLRALGELEIALALPRTLINPRRGLAELAVLMGLLESADQSRFEPVPEGYALYGRESGLPVWERRLVFTVENGRLTGIAGRWPLGRTAEPSDTVSRSAGSALLNLAEIRAAAGEPPACLLSMELGYRTAPLSPAVNRLIPYWRVVLDCGEFYINALTNTPL